jgi:hypothetical protein
VLDLRVRGSARTRVREQREEVSQYFYGVSGRERRLSQRRFKYLAFAGEMVHRSCAQDSRQFNYIMRNIR